MVFIAFVFYSNYVFSLNNASFFGKSFESRRGFELCMVTSPALLGRDFSINELLSHKRPAATNFNGYQQNLYEFKNFLERKIIRGFETEFKHCAFFLDDALSGSCR